ncbi:ABC transporter permease subunit [Halopiger djelfimassiliensis]|uniref:ABC transporter permease subunit n=1 Tax=Halopiger djelfimassiliensis TaxID=1293047 RepID=UPI00067816A0|nr:ABC transporter permease subunit [Halopiger djelfimassiliensis]
MSWRSIARKEIGDALRNRQLHTNAAMFVLVFGLIASLHANQARSGTAQPAALVERLMLVSMLLVPAVGLMLSYAAIVKPRANGQLALLLGMPHDRTDIVIGTYLGRYAILAVSIVAGVAAAVLVTLVFRVELAAAELVGFLVATAGLGLAFVAIAICLSAFTREQTWASVCAFVVFLLFVFGWYFVPGGIEYVVNGFETAAQEPWWAAYVRLLSPTLAYQRVIEVLVGDGADRRLAAFGSAVLLGWCLFAPALGVRRFATSDL